MRPENIVGRLYDVPNLPDELGGPILFRVLIVSGVGFLVGREEGRDGGCPRCGVETDYIGKRLPNRGFVWICCRCKGQVRRVELPISFLVQHLKNGSIVDRSTEPTIDLRYFHAKGKPDPSKVNLN